MCSAVLANTEVGMGSEFVVASQFVSFSSEIVPTGALECPVAHLFVKLCCGPQIAATAILFVCLFLSSKYCHGSGAVLNQYFYNY